MFVSRRAQENPAPLKIISRFSGIKTVLKVHNRIGRWIMNPFEGKTKNLSDYFADWNKLNSQPYDKRETDPYTKIRLILMNGTEFESVWNSHQFSRHEADLDLKREIALLRRVEQQQQKRISSFKPADESILEHTIGYEMLAVDLTAALAKREKSPLVKKALDFALLEDFDHLYRYADLLEGERHIKAENLVGKYVEIMPGRPTIAHHRYPADDIKPYIGRGDDLLTKLNVNIITAAEQQTMNYYMNVANFYDSDEGRRLYNEIAMVEEEHVSHYGSLKNPDATRLECLLMHEYTECYLYYSCYHTETDKKIRKLWEELYEQEVCHLRFVGELLKKYERKEACEVIPEPDFPELLKLEPSKEYVRQILSTVNLTADRDDYKQVSDMRADSDFFFYQKRVNSPVASVPSHEVIGDYIAKKGKDYRYQEGDHPIKELNDRSKDNTKIGREA